MWTNPRKGHQMGDYYSSQQIYGSRSYMLRFEGTLHWPYREAVYALETWQLLVISDSTDSA